MTSQTFSADQLKTLRNAFSSIQTVSPKRLSAFHTLFDGCSNEGLIQLATARITFVSKLAVNACARRGFSVASIHVLSLVAGGVDALDALKHVCGDAPVDAMLTSLYTELRAKAVR